MKEFDQETFENILSSKGVRIADYIHKAEEHDEDLLLRPLEVNDHTKGIKFLYSACYGDDSLLIA